ncbi:MAG TPA: threonine synthase, partial [Hyphomicrobiales bacterium]|nr:threonine synthase [Hyphomicrobiales bacterium]
AAIWREAGYLADPHTAVGLAVARRHAIAGVPMITLATAHPAKFPDAVVAASGQYPALPDWLGDLMEREEVFSVLDNDQTAVEAHIEARARAVAAGA